MANHRSGSPGPTSSHHPTSSSTTAEAGVFGEHSIPTLLSRSFDSQRTPWKRGGFERGRSPATVANYWLFAALLRLVQSSALAASTRAFKDRWSGPTGKLPFTVRSTLLIVARRLFRHVPILAVRRFRAELPLLGLSKSASPPSSIEKSTRPRRRVTASSSPDRACHARPCSALVVSTTSTAFSFSTFSGCCTRIRP